MAPARSLHEIIAGLTGDAGTSGDLAAVLHAGGHPDLPEELLAEAVISFADTAPAEVAEHLAPFVMAHGPIAEGDAGAGEIGRLPDLLATAPSAGFGEASALAAPEIDPPFEAGGADAAQPPDDVDEPAEPGWAPLDTAFGHGHGAAATPVEDAGPGAVAPEAAGYADPHDLPELQDVPSPAAELWATPSLPDDAPEIDDIDGD
ncbi:hypothetical protein [Actinoplanes sp. NPDC049118]|uniref:hypothetical protein n=1 Tax=Actinoplanes sp. NPDC049118 TaxID=3155769 RepID=UPI003401850F